MEPVYSRFTCSSKGLTPFAIVLLVLIGIGSVNSQATRVGFFSTSCPTAESIVSSTVQTHFTSKPEIASGLQRMHFHDCFVQCCDGSVLIQGPNTESTAIQNSGLNGFDVIEDAKAQLEAACPGVVSCADILALAARDSVVATSGRSWQVPTGRRDGQISLQSEAAILPGFKTPVADQNRLFIDKGLNTLDLVALVDPSIRPEFLPELQAICPQDGAGSNPVALDTNSGNRFDTSFFTNLVKGRGVLESNQVLWTDALTRPLVQHFSSAGGNFEVEVARSKFKMSNIGVKTGTQGEIKRVCSAIN